MPEAIMAPLLGNLYVNDEGKIVKGDWKNALLRFYVPPVASDQDKKVSAAFIQFFKDFFTNPNDTDHEKVKSMLALAEEYGPQMPNWDRLEHYTWAAREKLGLFDAKHARDALFAKCHLDNSILFAKWKNQGLDERAFWFNPDLVDFIFQAHLHRYINHPYNKHTIEMQPVLSDRGGESVIEEEPHLLVNGIQTRWSEIRQKLKIDKVELVYSIERGKKKYWVYLDEGFTQYNRHNFQAPHRIRQLDVAPMQNRVEIVTTHEHKEDWSFFDRLLKGARHSYFRIIPRAGFLSDHPGSSLMDGSVYSIGWGIRWTDVSKFSPLATVPGQWFCPDPWEYLKAELKVTPIDVSDEQMIKLMQIIQERSKQEEPFNIITGNCCGNTAQVLKEAGIIDLKTKDHFGSMLYKFLIPKVLRRPLEGIGSCMYSMTPDAIFEGVSHLTSFIHNCFWSPVFSLLGAWRAKLTYEDYETAPVLELTKVSNRIKALYSNVYDLFNSDNMRFDMTKSIYKWQKKQPSTYLEIRD